MIRTTIPIIPLAQDAQQGFSAILRWGVILIVLVLAGWILIAILTFYNSLLGFWLWNWCVQKLEAGTVSSFSYIQTGITLVIAWIFLGESIGVEKIIGAAAILAGVLIANIGRPAARDDVRVPISPGN